MSLDIFISTLTHDDIEKFERAVVERAFRAIAVDQSGNYWNLQTPRQEKTSVTISVDEEESISAFSANRPPEYRSFPEFWNAMFEVLRETYTVLFWPACEFRSALLCRQSKDARVQRHRCGLGRTCLRQLGRRDRGGDDAQFCVAMGHHSARL